MVTLMKIRQLIKKTRLSVWEVGGGGGGRFLEGGRHGVMHKKIKRQIK